MPEVPVESVRRAFHLLHELNRQRVSSVRQLHQATGLPKPTIVRLLDTLIGLGYVVNDRRQGGYQVTSLVRSLRLCGLDRTCCSSTAACSTHGDAISTIRSRR